MRFGFHKPPFRSIDHLHMHCIAGELTFLQGLKFRSGWHYVSAEDLIADLARRVAAASAPVHTPPA